MVSIPLYVSSASKVREKAASESAYWNSPLRVAYHKTVCASLCHTFHGSYACPHSTTLGRKVELIAVIVSTFKDKTHRSPGSPSTINRPAAGPGKASALWPGKLATGVAAAHGLFRIVLRALGPYLDCAVQSGAQEGREHPSDCRWRPAWATRTFYPQIPTGEVAVHCRSCRWRNDGTVLFQTSCNPGEKNFLLVEANRSDR
jgi:hypothetical protein